MANLYDATIICIPEISDEEIKEMRHIRPLIQDDDRECYRKIEGSDNFDARDRSFLWGVRPIGPGLYFGPLDRVTIVTYHKYGAPVIFKPSLAEVYAAIRRHMPDSWQRVEFFNLRSRHLDVENVIGSYHWCLCDLFANPIYESYLVKEAV